VPDAPRHAALATRGPQQADGRRELPALPDLVVLSHLHWQWVWQRPQHLVTRLARGRAAAGARTWFVEEPIEGDVPRAELHTEERDNLTRIWLVVPPADPPAWIVGFAVAGAEDYPEMLRVLLAEQARPAPDVWLYTPMAVDIALGLRPGRIAYDVMDDLTAFARPPAELLARQRRALREADVVYAGGRSLQRSVAAQGRPDCHLFPSGVEAGHYARSRALRRPRAERVAGYVGVIDERLDLQLLADLAASLPDWTVRVVGPVFKIEPATLPVAPNLEYPGMAAYEQLPAVMAGFDVAIMPFALNDATRSISPTKTLEYLAAGLPVVSTRVPDVVADYQGVVHLADDGAGFAAACVEVVEHRREDRDDRLRPLQARHEWDDIAARMSELLERAPSRLSLPRAADAAPRPSP
jgi:glycosyltransferase involved in cell wall biosynthesis